MAWCLAVDCQPPASRAALCSLTIRVAEKLHWAQGTVRACQQATLVKHGRWTKSYNVRKRNRASVYPCLYFYNLITVDVWEDRGNEGGRGEEN